MEPGPVVQPQVQPTQPEPQTQVGDMSANDNPEQNMNMPTNDGFGQNDKPKQNMDMGDELDNNDSNNGMNLDGDDQKKTIQQLAGKLSQELRTYNEQQPQPDSELNKYVAGMINKQAIEGLDSEDRKDVLRKIKNDDGNSESENEHEENDGGDEKDENREPQHPKMESVRRKINLNDKQFKKLFEISGNLDMLIDDVINDKDERKDDKIPPKSRIAYREKPYIAPEFK